MFLEPKSHHIITPSEAFKPSKESNSLLQTLGEFVAMYSNHGIESVHDNLALDKVVDNVYSKGLTRHFYSQLANGITVFGTRMTALYNSAGHVISFSGRYIKDVESVSPVPLVTEQEAVKIALLQGGDMNGNSTVKLAYYRTTPLRQVRGQTHLVWIVRVRSDSFDMTYFVSAADGSIVNQVTNRHNITIKALYENEYTAQNLVYIDGMPLPTDVDQANAVEVMAKIENMAMSFFDHSWNGDGDTMMSTVLEWSDETCPNAYYSGIVRICPQFTSSVDVLAHEWGHGIIDGTTGFIYQGESGALNEGYADIIGETMEIQKYNIPPRVNSSCLGQYPIPMDQSRWVMSASVMMYGTYGLRDMMDPNCYGNPNFVDDKGTICSANPMDDNGGVHTNSGIVGRMYQLVYDGNATLGINGNEMDAFTLFMNSLNLMNAQSTFIEFMDALVATCQELVQNEILNLNTCKDLNGAIAATKLNVTLCSTIPDNTSPFVQQFAPDYLTNTGSQVAFAVRWFTTNVTCVFDNGTAVISKSAPTIQPDDSGYEIVVCDAPDLSMYTAIYVSLLDPTNTTYGRVKMPIYNPSIKSYTKTISNAGGDLVTILGAGFIRFTGCANTGIKDEFGQIIDCAMCAYDKAEMIAANILNSQTMTCKSPAAYLHANQTNLEVTFDMDEFLLIGDLIYVNATAPPTQTPKYNSANSNNTSVNCTVILPVYIRHGEREALVHLEQSLESVVKQTMQEWRLIVVDDGSRNEQVTELLNRYAQNDRRVYVHSLEENRGLVCALNVAIDLVDKDCRLQVQVDYLEAHSNVDVLGTPVVVYSDADGVKADVGMLDIQEDNDRCKRSWHPSGKEMVEWSMIFNCCLNHPSVMMRRSVFDSARYDARHRHTEDYGLWLRLLFDGKVLANLPHGSQPLLLLRKHAAAISKQHAATQRTNSATIACDHIVARLERNGLPTTSVTVDAVNALKHPASITSAAQLDAAFQLLLDIERAVPASPIITQATNGRMGELIALLLTQFPGHPIIQSRLWAQWLARNPTDQIMNLLSLTSAAAPSKPAPIKAPGCQVICFSKDRAFQLQEYLISFHRFNQSVADFPVHITVLYTFSKDTYGASYALVASAYPNVTFIKEDNFATQLKSLVDTLAYSHTVFAVDDILYYTPFNLAAYCHALTAHPDALGFYIKLHPSITYCHTADEKITVPTSLTPHNYEHPTRPYYKWTRSEAKRDWNYPFDLCSTVYRTSTVQTIVNAIVKYFGAKVGTGHPNRFETHGNRVIIQKQYDNMPACLCESEPVMSMITINRVQDIYINPVYQSNSPDTDLTLDQLDQFIGTSQHMDKCTQ
eukprot:gene4318-5042_t